MGDVVKHIDVPEHLVDPKTGEAYDLPPAAMLSIFPTDVVADAIYQWEPAKVAALLRTYMDWESEVGRHLKRVMSDALYANLIDRSSKVTVEVDGGIVVKGEKKGTAENAEAWNCSDIYDACVAMVDEGLLLADVLEEFDIEQTVTVKCTATLVGNLRDRGGVVGERIDALVTKAPRARKAVSVAWK